MKIALLSPFPRSMPSHPYQPLDSMVSLLAAQLLDMGVEVTLFAGGDSLARGEPEPTEPAINPAARECLRVAEIFERAEEFDLIHSYLEFVPLSYSGFTATPLLTSIPGLLSPSLLPMYKKYNERTYYVTTSEADKNPELDYIATICPASPAFPAIDVVEVGDREPTAAGRQLAERYLELYRKILDDRENYRPWGHYHNLLERHDHKIKEIVVNPGARLSLQKHRRRAEHWTVVSGEALVTVGDQEFRLQPGTSVDIPRGAVHRVKNPGDIPLVLVEVQMGDYFGEDDIIRLQDDYDRCST